MCQTPQKFQHPVATVVTVTDEEAMRRAIALAAEAAAVGEVPVGAVVLRGGQIVAERRNEREASNDPCAHAELLALRDACAAADSWRLEDATVVVTLEPCPMCAGALLASRVARVVYGAADMKAGALGSLYNLAADPRLHHNFEVTSGVLAEEAGALLSSYFAALR